MYDALSRYTISEDGRHAVRRKVPQATGYTTYMCGAGDTIEGIATQLFGNPRRWWEIADINPQIKFPTDITVGTVLRIPTGS